MTRLGIIAFYSLPLLLLYASAEYTPEVLQDGVYVGAIVTIMGLVWAGFAAPSGAAGVAETVRKDRAL